MSAPAPTTETTVQKRDLTPITETTVEKQDLAPATDSQPPAPAAATEDPIEAADPDDGTSDYYTDSNASDTTSLNSSIQNYVYENGRRYQSYSEGKYAQPNDETEQGRLDLVHHIQNMLLGGELYTAPISKNPQRVLDCGTGTGIWALDFGDMHPSAHVIGVDLSPIQPRWTAPNVEFQVDDLELPWTFPEDHFDFIHSRHMALGLHDWPRYISQIFRHLQPGGWVELSEQEQVVHSDDDTLKGSFLERYLNLYLEAAPKAGLNFQTDESLVKLLEEAGFVDVRVKTFKQPWGHWPKNRRLKELGHTMSLNAEQGAFESYGLALFTRFCGMSNEEVSDLCAGCFKDMVGRKVHVYNRIWHVSGRKPGN